MAKHDQQLAKVGQEVERLQAQHEQDQEVRSRALPDWFTKQ